ncbi:NUDIX hydrolase [Planosporangium thailandense]|uniref:NUDIX hydrolase n=1 Tax=Planosporangium thailandense TaxID=765197 RepID=A0ABX0XWE8_9ACTN|nr:NUDIX hydrolase [Planosporangium thailandense]NJC69700.1 NUDIX hydrolase [Planosporangium thailandense]
MRALRLAAFRAFYRLPFRWRRRLVRMGSVHYIVGAVTIVRDADAESPGRILLLRQPPGPGWSVPGGLLNRGERPIAGAARELAEETGIRLPIDRLRPATPNAVVHTGGRWVDMVFETEVPADAPLDPDEAEVHEAAWHPLDALPRLTGPTARLLAHYGIGPLKAEDD